MALDKQILTFLVGRRRMCRKHRCAKYVLRHFNLFKEMLNTNKDFLSKRLNMARRKIQVIIFCSFDFTTDGRNLDETYVDRDLIGNKKIPFHHEKKTEKDKESRHHSMKSISLCKF